MVSAPPAPLPPHDEHHAHPRFPWLVFLLFTLLQTAVPIALFWVSAPGAFAAEVGRPLALVAAVFWLGLPLSLFEYLYHRYLLHSAVLPFLGIMHKKHSLHHNLTSVKAPVSPKEPEKLVPVRNAYPIEEEEQEEAMMFPHYALSIFQALFTVLLALPLKALLPGQPVVLGTILAVTLAYALYEIWHQVLHLPFDRYWGPLMRSRRLGRLASYVYSFHLVHHWRPQANLAVVGFWGLALWDHLFRTHHRPPRMPLRGAEVAYRDAELPAPRWPISLLDRWQGRLYERSRRLERALLERKR